MNEMRCRWCVEGARVGTSLAKGKWTHHAHSRRLGKVRSVPFSLNTPLSFVRGGLRFEATLCHPLVPCQGSWETPASRGLVETGVLPLTGDHCPSRCPSSSPKLRKTLLTPTTRITWGYGGGNQKAILLNFLQPFPPSPWPLHPNFLAGKRSGCYFIWNYWNCTVSCQLPLPPPALLQDGR